MLADILAQCGAEMGKGEFGGGNDGPLWFLLRTRNSGPTSEGPVYTQKQMHWFLLYQHSLYNFSVSLLFICNRPLPVFFSCAFISK